MFFLILLFMRKVVVMPMVCMLLNSLHLLIICFILSLFFSRIGSPSGYQTEAAIFVRKEP